MDNVILDEELANWKRSKIMYHPALVINNRTIRGKIEGSRVFDFICNAFNETPSTCLVTSNEGSGIGIGTLFFLLMVIAIISAIIIYFNIRKTKKEFQKELNFQVSAAITQYMALKDQKKEGDK